MKEYLHTTRGVLYQGDALEVLKQLPDESVDLVVLDPPYVEFRDERVKGTKTWGVNYELISNVFSETTRVMKQNAVAFLFGFPSFYLRFAEPILNNFRLWFDVIWEKPWPTNPLLSRQRPLNIHEQALVLVRKDAKVTQVKYYPERIGSWDGTPIKRGGSMGRKFGNVKYIRKAPPNFRYPKTVVKLNNVAKRHGHPTEKPEALLKWFLKGWTDSGDLILDPFAGSGTTLVVAEKLGRHWIGIEINPDYCEIIKRRFEKEVGGIAKSKPLDEFMGVRE